jgi:hypothetical protein
VEVLDATVQAEIAKATGTRLRIRFEPERRPA